MRPRFSVVEHIVKSVELIQRLPCRIIQQMLNNLGSDNLFNEPVRLAWKRKAEAQGIVCLLCKNVPRLERRAAFFGTGLCARCSDEMEQPA